MWLMAVGFDLRFFQSYTPVAVVNSSLLVGSSDFSGLVLEVIDSFASCGTQRWGYLQRVGVAGKPLRW